MKQTKIVLIESSKLFAQEITDGLCNYSDITVAGCTSSAADGAALCLSVKADVLVCDAEIGQENIFSVISKVKNDLSVSTAIILTASHGSEALFARAASCGVSYFLEKPFSAQLLYQQIMFLSKLADSKACSAGEEFDVEIMVSNMIKTIGVPAHIKGYQFLRDAIMWVIEDMEIINAVTKELYPGIAKKHKTTSSRVERAIRHAIEVSWQRGDIDTLDKIFGHTVKFTKDKPTNSEFIAMIADRIRLQLKHRRSNVVA